MTTQVEPSVIRVPLDDILPNPYQPASRLQVDEVTVKSIAESIRIHGLIFPPVCRQLPGGKYEIADGWIRLSAFRCLRDQHYDGYDQIPVTVRDLHDREMADLIIEANTKRKDMSPVEEAQCFKRYLEEFGVTQAELATKHNMSQGELSNRLRLLEAPDEIQKAVISREISETHARVLLRMVGMPAELKTLLRYTLERNLPVAKLEKEVADRLWNRSMPLYKSQQNYNEDPIFDLTACPKCEHQQILTNPWYKDQKGSRCMNKECWKEKQAAAKKDIHKAAMQRLAKDGITEFVPSNSGRHIYQLSYKDWEAECKDCAKRGGHESYDGSVKPVCLDDKCYDAKRETFFEAREAAETEAREKIEKAVSEAFEHLHGLSPDIVARATAESLIRSLPPWKLERFPYLRELTGKLGEAPPSSINDIVARMNQISGATLMFKVIPRIAFDLFRKSDAGSDRARVNALFNKFQGSKGEPVAVDTQEEEEDGDNDD